MQRQKQRAQPAIEEPAAQQQDDVAPGGPGQRIDQQKCWQEQCQEFKRGENHVCVAIRSEGQGIRDGQQFCARQQEYAVAFPGLEFAKIQG
ncbi:hypothetical protein D3C86_1947020 [compost metagenome]